MPAIKAQPGEITIRFYRIGHGDCFMLAMPKEDGGTAYVLIDCGYKPGSQKFIHKKPEEAAASVVFEVADVLKDLKEACGGHLDLLVITHEHQDHVNGLKKLSLVKGLTIGQVWCAWTEKQGDPLAEDLRKKHNDTLLGLVAARNALSSRVGAADSSLRRIDDFLMLDMGIEEAHILGAAKPEDSLNKQGMKLVKDKAINGVECFKPGMKAVVPGTKIQAFMIGPPYDDKALNDEDPTGPMAFPTDNHPFGFSAAASLASSMEPSESPFPRRYRAASDDLRIQGEINSIADPEERAARERMEQQLRAPRDAYGIPNPNPSLSALPKNSEEVSEGADWRQIEGEWLYSSESLALALNRGVNNTSLVIAFELPETKKVMLFIGDAQSGSWKTWNQPTWLDDQGEKIKAKDLLARTVLYKVGHHGSHNATLKGTLGDEHPNLAWMGQGRHGDEFTAMITAVRAWATQESVAWNHPLPSIKEALLGKCAGRVIQTDTNEPSRPDGVSDADWKKFTERFKPDPNGLFFDLKVVDRW